MVHSEKQSDQTPRLDRNTIPRRSRGNQLNGIIGCVPAFQASSADISSTLIPQSQGKQVQVRQSLQDHEQANKG